MPQPRKEQSKTLPDYTSGNSLHVLEAKRINSVTNLLPTLDKTPEKQEAKDDVLYLTDLNTIKSESQTSPSENTLVRPSARKEKPKGKISNRRTKKDKEDVKTNHVITEFFPVRKSSRKTSKALKNEQEQEILRKILEECEEGLKVTQYEGKGRGVEATKAFSKGDFIVEYAGELVELKEAKSREEVYKRDSSYGCYMYFFNHRGKSYCIDATAESGKLGRLLNHSRTKPNCKTKTVDIESVPVLILVAARNINPGEELVYDYGERSKEAMLHNPWLKD